jgi:hypothetical protein
LLVENKRCEDNAILDPLLGAHGLQEIFEHGPHNSRNLGEGQEMDRLNNDLAVLKMG